MEYTSIAGTYVGTELMFIPVETLSCATVHSYMSYAKDLNILGDFETIVLLVLLEGKLVAVLLTSLKSGVCSCHCLGRP